MFSSSTANDLSRGNAICIQSVFAAACVSLIAMCGCQEAYNGPPRGAIQGEVTLNGERIDSGTIIFMPAVGTSGPSAGATISNGRFDISQRKGPGVGKYQVQIHSIVPTGKKVPAGSPHPPGTMIDETVDIIPKQYNTESKLECDVMSGKNAFDFALTSK